jgi:O-antigen ligase
MDLAVPLTTQGTVAKATAMPSPVPAGATAGEALAEAVAAIDGRPWRDPRRIGLWILRVGVGLALGGLVLKIAVLNIGVITALGGWCLCRVPVARLPGFTWALGFTLCCAATAAVARYGGGDGDPIHGFGLLYSWTALYVGQAAFTGPVGRRVLGVALMGLTATVFASTLLAAMQFFIGHHKDYPWRLLQAPLGERAVISEGFEDINLTQGFIMSVVALLMAFGPSAPGGPAAPGGPRGDDRLPMAPRHRWTAAGLALFAMLISAARGAVAGFIAGAWAASAAMGWKAFLRAVLVTLALGLCALVGLALLQPKKFEAMRHGHDGRWVIWRTAAAMVADHPWTGVGGPEAFKRSFNETFPRIAAVRELPEFPGGAPHAHNSLLTIAANHGIPAAVLYLAFLAAALRGAMIGGWGRALALAVVADALVDGQFEDLAGHTVPAYALFLTLAVASLPALRKEPSNAPATAKDPHAPVTPPSPPAPQSAARLDGSPPAGEAP